MASTGAGSAMSPTTGMSGCEGATIAFVQWPSQALPCAETGASPMPSQGPVPGCVAATGTSTPPGACSGQACAAIAI